MDKKLTCLARERNRLANERTLLSYVRTSLALCGFSIFIFKFFETIPGVIIGIFLLILGSGLIIFGLYRFFSYQKKCDLVN